jgi:hypothetical protein
VSKKRTKVIIDTCAARSVIARDPCADSWEDLIPLQDRFHFALCETSIVELYAQLQEAGLDWALWMSGRDRLIRLVDHDEPVLGLWETDPKVTRKQRAREKHHLKMIYRHLTSVAALLHFYELQFKDFDGEWMRFERVDARALLNEGIERYARPKRSADRCALTDQHRKAPDNSRVLARQLEQPEGLSDEP